MTFDELNSINNKIGESGLLNEALKRALAKYVDLGGLEKDATA